VMALIYPEEAWARFGPKVAVHDASGRRLRRVCACDPLTGEVIQRLPNTHPSVPLVGCYCLLVRWLTRRGLIGPIGSLTQVHWFAPAPLTITPAA
jgi:hypothetical protein